MPTPPISNGGWATQNGPLRVPLLDAGASPLLPMTVEVMARSFAWMEYRKMRRLLFGLYPEKRHIVVFWGFAYFLVLGLLTGVDASGWQPPGLRLHRDPNDVLLYTLFTCITLFTVTKTGTDHAQVRCCLYWAYVAVMVLLVTDNLQPSQPLPAGMPSAHELRRRLLVGLLALEALTLQTWWCLQNLLPSAVLWTVSRVDLRLWWRIDPIDPIDPLEAAAWPGGAAAGGAAAEAAEAGEAAVGLEEDGFFGEMAEGEAADADADAAEEGEAGGEEAEEAEAAAAAPAPRFRAPHRRQVVAPPPPPVTATATAWGYPGVGGRFNGGSGVTAWDNPAKGSDASSRIPPPGYPARSPASAAASAPTSASASASPRAVPPPPVPAAVSATVPAPPLPLRADEVQEGEGKGKVQDAVFEQSIADYLTAEGGEASSRNVGRRLTCNPTLQPQACNPMHPTPPPHATLQVGRQLAAKGLLRPLKGRYAGLFHFLQQRTEVTPAAPCLLLPLRTSTPSRPTPLTAPYTPLHPLHPLRCSPSSCRPSAASSSTASR